MAEKMGFPQNHPEQPENLGVLSRRFGAVCTNEVRRLLSTECTERQRIF
jgi:hypothetical protein